MAGQQIFLSHGLMENGSIWGHGAYLGPDLSNEYLQTMALDVLLPISTPMSSNSEAVQPNDPNELDAEVAHILKANRYEPRSDTLTFTEAEADSSRTQQQKWRDYLSAPDHNGGLTAGLIQNPAIRRDKRGGLIPAKLIVVHSQTSDRCDPSGRRSAVWPPAVGAI